MELSGVFCLEIGLLKELRLSKYGKMDKNLELNLILNSFSSPYLFI